MSRTKSFDLTPIERNARLTPTRIVAKLSWYPRAGRIMDIEIQDTHREIQDTFLKVLQNWTVLTGVIRHVADGEIRLEYPEKADREELLKRLEYRKVTLPKSTTGELLEILNGRFSRAYFSDNYKHPHECFPVTLMANYVGEVVVALGFSFSQVIFDSESINNFIHTFFSMTGSSRSKPSGIVNRLYEYNLGDVEPNHNMSDFYDWGTEQLLESPPREMLSCQRFSIAPEAGFLAIENVRSTLDRNRDMSGVYNQDCIAALFWTAIMRSRFQRSEFQTRDEAVLNVTVPSSLRQPPMPDPRYFGNSAVTVRAKATAMEILQGVDSKYDIDDDIPDHIGKDEMTFAAKTIRKAFRRADKSYVQRLMLLKGDNEPQYDWDAYDRGLNRLSTALCLEDWTNLYSNDPTGIPLTQDNVPQFFPCAEDIEMGSIILMPRNPRTRSWQVWICLEEGQMEHLKQILENQAWWNPDREPARMRLAQERIMKEKAEAKEKSSRKDEATT